MRAGLSDYVWQELTEQDRARLHAWCAQWSQGVRYDKDFDYYAIEFTDENWLLASMAEPHLAELLRVH